jgi:hypothetical protein
MLNFIGKKTCDQPDTGPNVDQNSFPYALAQEKNVARIGDVGYIPAADAWQSG